jgi:hypothetical protein
MATTTITKTETKPTLERLRAERADTLRQYQRATALMDSTRTQDRDAEHADVEELLRAPEVVIRTRHELRVLDLKILAAEREVAAAADAARTALLAEGQRLLAREFPALVQEQRRLQQRWQGLATQLEAIDHRLGGAQRFLPAAWPGTMGVNGTFDAFVQAIVDGFRLDLDA